MHPELTRLLAEERFRELEDARRGRTTEPKRSRTPLRVRIAAALLESRRPRTPRRPGRLTIRPAQREDGAVLQRLAQLDEQPAPPGASLVAELDGRVVAALPLPAGPAIAAPFVPTEDVIVLLELCARQLAA